MPIFSFAVIIIIGVVISIIKITSGKKQREERERREQERRDEHIREAQRRVKERQAQREQPQAQPAAKSTTKRSAAARDPFPAYNGSFDRQSEYSASLSAAQLNEWMLDFAAAEKAGAPRPEVGKIKPLFARYLYENGFNYRLLRKIRGYTPQNRLQFSTNANKIKPEFITPTVSNDSITLPPLEQKTPPSSAYVRQKGATVQLPKKNFKERRQLYESFYVNKD